MSHKPFFSIIIPTYNRKQTLIRAIKSVLRQRCQSSPPYFYQLILVDDASTDGSRDAVNELLLSLNKSGEKFLCLSTGGSSPKGVSYARNIGLTVALGEWVSFLDSDDEWLPDKLHLTHEFIRSFPHIKIVHGDEIWIRNGIRVNQMKKHKKYGGYIFDRCLDLCLISPSAVSIHKEVFNDVGIFKEDYPVCEDYDLWLRMTLKYEIGFISRPIIVKYGGHNDQLSRRYFAMDYWRVKALYDLLNLHARAERWHRDPMNVNDFRRKKNFHFYYNNKMASMNEQQVLLVKDQILRRCKILTSGYLKHGGLEKKIYEDIINIEEATKTLD